MVSYEDRLLRLRDVLEIIPVGKTSWYKGVKSGIYPAPYKLGDRMTVWRASEIYSFINSIPRNQ